MTIQYLSFTKLELIDQWKRTPGSFESFIADKDDCIIHIIPLIGILSKDKLYDYFKFKKGRKIMINGNVLIYDLKDLNSINDKTANHV